MLEPAVQQSYHPLQTPAGSSADQSVAPPSIGSLDEHQTLLQTRPEKPTFWKWITTREIVFIFLACSVGTAIFRTKDTVFFEIEWRESIDDSVYKNGKFPMGPEKLPPPIVTDLDSNGVNDMLILTYDHKLELFTFPDRQYRHGTTKPHQTISKKAVFDLREVAGDSKPVTMAAGYLQPYQSMLQVRQQVVAVLTEDWTVLCFDPSLKLLWKVCVSEKDKKDFSEFSISEATMLIAPVSVHKRDTGVIIIGGREMNKRKAPEESLKRMRRGVAQDSEEQLIDTLGYYSIYALEGRSGEQRWKQTPKDFRTSAAYPPASSFQHLKLIMHKKLNRDGEVSWHQFSSALRKSLPHSWTDVHDTHFSLGHFKKDRKRSDKTPVTDEIAKVGDLAMEHIGGLAFGGQPPHSPSEHVESPNVLILHSVKGLEVLHVYLGRPLCSMRLSPYHSAHADIDADGTIDHVHAVVNPGEAGFSDDEGDSSPDCYGVATAMASSRKHLFKHSICKATHWSETFIAADKWLPVLNKSGRKNVDHDITEPLAPVLIESSYHSAPLKLHMGGGGWDVKGIFESTIGAPSLRSIPSLANPSTHHQRPMYDSVFVLSSGRVTSVGPRGEFNWQMDTLSDWDEASQVIYNPQHTSWKKDPNQVMFVHGGFTPSATPISLQAYGKKDHILLVGWKMMEILSAKDGHVITVTRLPCQSVQPPVIADFNGNGWNDVIITCPNGYLGFAMEHKSGFFQTTIVSLFVGVVIVVVAIYTRQRTIGLLPVVKAAQD